MTQHSPLAPIHSIPAQVRDRLDRVVNASWSVRRYMSYRPKSALAKAWSALETLGEIALLVELRLHGVDLKGVGKSVVDRLVDARCNELVVRCAREVIEEIVRAERASDQATTTPASREDLLASDEQPHRLPDAMDRLDAAVAGLVCSRYVHLQIGDWVRRPNTDSMGEVLAIGPGLLLVIHFMSGAGHQRERSAGERFTLPWVQLERASRPEPTPLIAPGLFTLRDAQRAREELAFGRPFPAWQSFLRHATMALCEELAPHDIQVAPILIPSDLPAPGPALRADLIAISEICHDLYVRFARFIKVPPPSEVAALVTRVDAFLGRLRALVAASIERRLPARIYFGPSLAPGLLRAEHGEWFVTLDDGERHVVTLESLALSGNVPPTSGWPGGTFVDASEEEEHTHGAHWGPFLDDSLDLVSRLPEILPHGLAQTGFGVERKASRAIPKSWPEGDLWAWPLRFQGVHVVVERGRETKTLASMFPFYAAGSQQTVTLDEVTVWSNGVEAQLTVEWGESTVTFFDTHYLLNRGFYEAGARYEVILTGIAYAAGPVTATELTVTPLGEATQTWSLRGFGGLLPGGGDRDEYRFRGSIKRVSAVCDWLGQNGWKLRTTVSRLGDDERELDIVVTTRAWKGGAVPQVGQEIEGSLWLQGYLWSLAP